MKIELFTREGHRVARLGKDRLHYLASPYRPLAVPGDDGLGLRKAFTYASLASALLVKDGYKVFSPIAHSHPIACAGQIDAEADEPWMTLSIDMLDRCDAIIALMVRGWEQSRGMAAELARADAKKKLVYTARFSTTEDEPEATE